MNVSRAKSKRIALALALGIAITGVAATPAWAIPSSPQQAEQQHDARIASPQSTASMAITRYITENPDPNSGGVSRNGDGVIVHWKGEAPIELQSLAESLDVNVQFVNAPYSSAELQAEARRVAEANLSTVASIGPNESYSGLDVELKRAADAQRAPAPSSTVPVSIVGTADWEFATRNSTDGALFGGSLLRNTLGGVCTAGWPVTIGNTTSAMTTAAHCPEEGIWQSHDSGAVIGSITARSDSSDTAAIPTRVAGSIWNGPWNSNTVVRIIGVQPPEDNAPICVSGGMLGERCNNVMVRGTGKFITVDVDNGEGGTREVVVGPGYFVMNEDVVNNAQAAVSRSGNSGSPSYTYASPTEVIAHGMISAGDPTFSTIECGEQHPDYVIPTPDQPLPCTSRAFVVNAAEALLSIRARIRLG